jgi:hypothetical protein
MFKDIHPVVLLATIQDLNHPHTYLSDASHFGNVVDHTDLYVDIPLCSHGGDLE